MKHYRLVVSEVYCHSLKSSFCTSVIARVLLNETMNNLIHNNYLIILFFRSSKISLLQRTLHKLEREYYLSFTFWLFKVISQGVQLNNHVGRLECRPNTNHFPKTQLYYSSCIIGWGITDSSQQKSSNIRRVKWAQIYSLLSPIKCSCLDNLSKFNSFTKQEGKRTSAHPLPLLK
jgi:hypothetical protein